MIFLLLCAFFSARSSAARPSNTSLRASARQPSSPEAPIGVQAAPVETSAGPRVVDCRLNVQEGAWKIWAFKWVNPWDFAQ
jgi:hypothetical protein